VNAEGSPVQTGREIDDVIRRDEWTYLLTTAAGKLSANHKPKNFFSLKNTDFRRLSLSLSLMPIVKFWAGLGVNPGKVLFLY